MDELYSREEILNELRIWFLTNWDQTKSVRIRRMLKEIEEARRQNKLPWELDKYNPEGP